MLIYWQRRCFLCFGLVTEGHMLGLMSETKTGSVHPLASLASSWQHLPSDQQSSYTFDRDSHCPPSCVLCSVHASLQSTLLPQTLFALSALARWCSRRGFGTSEVPTSKWNCKTESSLPPTQGQSCPRTSRSSSCIGQTFHRLSVSCLGRSGIQSCGTSCFS